MEGGPHPKNPDKAKQKENKSRKQAFKYGNNFHLTKKKKQPKTKTIDKKKKQDCSCLRILLVTNSKLNYRHGMFLQNNLKS